MAQHPFTPDFENLPNTLPVFPLSGAIVLPHAQLPLNIFEPRYLNMVFDALGESRMIGMIQPDLDASNANNNDAVSLSKTGCAGRITTYRETEDGRVLIALTGVCRFDRGEEIATIRGYRRIKPIWQPYAHDYAEDGVQINTMELIGLLEGFFQQRNIEADLAALAKMPGPQLVNFLAVNLPFEQSEKQALVEARDIAARARLLTGLTKLSASAGLQVVDTDSPVPPTKH